MATDQQQTRPMKATTSFERSTGVTTVTVERGEIIDATPAEVKRHYTDRQQRPLLIPATENEVKERDAARARASQADEIDAAGGDDDGDDSGDATPLTEGEVLDYLSGLSVEEAGAFNRAMAERIRSGGAPGFSDLRDDTSEMAADLDVLTVQEFLRTLSDDELSEVLAEFENLGREHDGSDTAAATAPQGGK